MFLFSRNIALMTVDARCRASGAIRLPFSA
jgi:hypothetical protein